LGLGPYQGAGTAMGRTPREASSGQIEENKKEYVKWKNGGQHGKKGKGGRAKDSGSSDGAQPPKRPLTPYF